MNSQGCTPDVVTYTALISAFERGGQWQRALGAFHKMCAQGCKPDAIVYNGERASPLSMPPPLAACLGYTWCLSAAWVPLVWGPSHHI